LSRCNVMMKARSLGAYSMLYYSWLVLTAIVCHPDPADVALGNLGQSS
jgi:spermidine synthase